MSLRLRWPGALSISFNHTSPRLSLAVPWRRELPAASCVGFSPRLMMMLPRPSMLPAPAGNISPSSPGGHTLRQAFNSGLTFGLGGKAPWRSSLFHWAMILSVRAADSVAVHWTREARRGVGLLLLTLSRATVLVSCVLAWSRREADLDQHPST